MALTDLHENLTSNRSNHTEHLPQSEFCLTCFGDGGKKLLSNLYVLYLVIAAMLTDKKSQQQFYEEYPKKHSYQVWL